MDTQKSEEQRSGRFSEDDLISLMDELCIAIGEVLMNFQFLHESILDQAVSQQTQEKISKLQSKLADERARLKTQREAAARKRELEKIRSDHERERERQANRSEQTEGRSGGSRMPLYDGHHRLVGWIEATNSKINFYDRNGRIVSREFADGIALGRDGSIRGRGKGMGLVVLGQSLRA
jgi:hypothetical protein